MLKAEEVKLGEIDIQEELQKLDFPGIAEMKVSINPLNIPPIQRYKIVPIEWQNKLQELGLGINIRRGNGEKISQEEISGYNIQTRRHIEEAGKQNEGEHFSSFDLRIKRFDSDLELIADTTTKEAYLASTIDKFFKKYSLYNPYFNSNASLRFKSYKPQLNTAAKEEDVFNFLLSGGKIDYSKEVFFLEEHLKILHIENLVSFYRWLLKKNEILEREGFGTIETNDINQSTLAPKVIAQVYIAKAGGKPITPNNVDSLFTSFGAKSKNSLMNSWRKWNDESKRLNIDTANKRSANNHLKAFNGAIAMLSNNTQALALCEADLMRIKKTYSKYF